MPSSKPPKRSTLQRFTSKIIGGSWDEKIKMPGKSNKFDFTNRANSGVKLGEIIGNTFQKEVDKARKDAERHAAKARKQSSDSSGGVFELTGTTHVIDLKAPGKDLGDDGVCVMADGMEIALRGETGASHLVLEDMNLSGNGITTASLARLAPIIKLAKIDLKTVNLSNNSIQVASDEQAEQWETFLLAFTTCMRLRRLDLSGNTQLGSRALEIFARIHVGERPVDPNPPHGNASVLSLVSEVGEEGGNESEQVNSATEDEELTMPDPMTAGTFIKRRCGLRSIPYITLHNIGLNDAGALWLSYVLEDHYYPSQLISELNATNAASIIKTYQQNTHSRGIDWNENNSIGKEGAHLLERTEGIRETRLHDQGTGATDMLDAEEEDAVEVTSGRGSQASVPPRSKHGNRRASMRSIQTVDGGEHEVSELESARKKIMRQIIGHDGVNTVELWSASIEIFWTSRMILYLSPRSRKCYTGDPMFATDAAAPADVQPPSSATGPTKEGIAELGVDTGKAKEVTRASYASKLQSVPSGDSDDSGLAITEVTNTPVTPLRLQKPTHRKGAFSEGSAVEEVSEKLNALIVRDDSPLRFVKYQQRRIEAAATEGKNFRDRSTSTHLPTDVAARIISFALTTKKMADCEGGQRRRAVERGQDKTTLTAETEWLKKDRSAQVLMLLDSIQCLCYGQ